MGKQNPYCIARVGQEALRCPADIRGGQIPAWDHEVRFQVYDVPDQKTLKLSVLDENDSKPELIGDAVIKLQPAFQAHPSQGHDGWHELTYRGKYAGEVYIEMTFYPSKPSLPKKVRQSNPAVDMLASHMSNMSIRPLPPDPSQTTTAANPRPLPMPSSSVSSSPAASTKSRARSPQPHLSPGRSGSYSPQPIPNVMPRGPSPFSPPVLSTTPLPLPNRMPSPSNASFDSMGHVPGLVASHTAPSLSTLGHRALPSVPQHQYQQQYAFNQNGVQHRSMDNLRRSVREQPSLPSFPSPSPYPIDPPSFSPSAIRRSSSSDFAPQPLYTSPTKPLVLSHRKSASHDLTTAHSSGKFKVSRKPVQAKPPIAHSYDESANIDDHHTFIPFSPDHYSNTAPEPPVKKGADQRLDHRSWAPVPRLKSANERKQSPVVLDPGVGDYKGEGQWDISRQINDGYGDSIVNKMNRVPRVPPKIPLGMSAQEYEAIEFDPYRQDEDPYVYEWK